MTDHEPVQHVEARAGFAYGVIGADLHVFGDGVPVYLLENWRPSQGADREWLRTLPSRLLNARYGVVPFTGRVDELASLHIWRRTGPRLSALWLYGPGGAGKSRLAAEFAASCAADGWKVVAAVHGPGSVLPPGGSRDMRLTDAAGLLLIVDYADRWPHAHLTWLLSNALLHQIGVPTRVLLIGRTADPAPRLRGVLTNLQADLELRALPPLPSAGDERPEMFDAARDAFARAYELDDPPSIGPPDDLTDPELGLTLAVHMAALVAVDAHVHGRHPPAGTAGLTIYLLDREQVHWATLYADPEHSLEARPGYRTPPETMNHVVFAAALTGDLSGPDGDTVLRQVEVGGDPGTALADHGVCYPAGAGRVLEPLYPDRLAEDFLALTLPSHSAPYPTQQWADATCRTIVAASGLDSQADPGRALTFLASAADRWPHVGSELLYPLLTAEPDLIVEAGNAALIALAGIRAIDMNVLQTVAQRLPGGRHVTLDVGKAAVGSRLITNRLTLTTDPDDRAQLLGELSATLAAVGRREEALEHSRAATEIFRDLGEPAPRSLAASLSNLSNRLDAVGAAQDALAAAREAVDIWDELDEQPADPRSATVILNLGIFLSKTGRNDESHAVLLRAVTGLRQLSESGETAYREQLASALNSLALVRSDLGDRDAAVATAEESVALYRTLVDEDWTAHVPDLGMALTNLGGPLSAVGRHDEALVAARSATRLYRELARLNPGAYRPRLGGALVNETGRLRRLGHRDEALSSAEEALVVYRALAEAMPAAYASELAVSLGNVAVLRSKAGRSAEAVPLADEAVVLRRKLAEAAPQAHLPELAATLTSYVDVLGEAGSAGDALLVAEEAVALHRRLADTAPLAHSAALAHALTRLAEALTTMDRAEEALSHLDQAAAVHRQLADKNQAVAFGNVLLSISVLSSTLGFTDRALAANDEATQLYRTRADTDPEAERSLATALLRLSTLHPEGAPARRDAAVESARRFRNLDARQPDGHPATTVMAFTAAGIALDDAGDHAGAAAHFTEAVARNRVLAERDPGTHRENLAASLNALGNACARTGRHQEAMAATTESAAVWRILAAKDPGSYLSELSVTLDNLRQRYVETGQIAESLAVSAELVDVCRRLATADPAHRSALARSLNNVSPPLAMAGRYPEALAASAEATGLLRQLMQDEGAAYQPLYAVSLHTTGNRWADAGRADEAVRHFSEALALARVSGPPELPDLARRGLADVLAGLPPPPELAAPPPVLNRAFLEALDWSQKSGDLLAVERAIRLGRGAAAAVRDPEDWATTVTLLGMVLHTKYAAIEDRAALVEAVQALRSVGAHMPPTHRTAAMSHFHLGTALRSAYQDCGDPALLDEAIGWLRPSSRHPHASQAQSLGQLATCLGLLADVRGDPAFLAEAQWAAREAIAVCLPAQRQLRQLGLAGTLAQVHRMTGNTDALHEAIALCRAALEASPAVRTQAEQTLRILEERLR
ncbi:tetratricopeptide repeat protein [Micromonospora sp. CPCC 205539]|uniref:tetratricopeptide repeat protein n=1 Tax=Micromonospora sp. CPCC 205539 TaxID=3122408 RepID=UPI002FF15CF5